MDAEPGTGLLNLRAPLALLGVLACGGPPQEPPASLPALAMTTTLLRLPAGGGPVLAYATDSLRPTGWQSAPEAPAAATALGFDTDQRIAWYLDTRGRLVALDLEAGITRVFVPGTRRAAVGPDGAAYAVDSAGRLIRVARRAATYFPVTFEETPSQLFGTLNGQVVALSGDGDAALQLHGVERSADPVPVASGPAAATWWGELVAVADDDRVRLIRPGTPERDRRTGLPEPATALAFSPSGHRLYALLPDGRLIVADRFSGERVGEVELPGPATEVRTEPTGRWILIRPASIDAVWVVDLAMLRHTATVPTAWTGSLPLVAGSATLIAAQGEHAVSLSLTTTQPEPLAQVIGGAADVWLATQWVPRQRAATVVAAAESAAAAQDSLLMAVVAPRPDDGRGTWLQVSSSQNPSWADGLAEQLARAGFPATVWSPTAPDEGYRVVVGPYGSRDEAEAAGRSLGRPYFVVTRPPPGR